MGFIQIYSKIFKIRANSQGWTDVQLVLSLVLLNITGLEQANKDICAERILFIDDEISIVELYQKALKKLGYHVTTQTSSIEALKCFKANPKDFDLVITDMTMPNMTGDKLAQAMIEISPELPIILCTGYNKKITPNPVNRQTIKVVLKKPISKIDFAVVIRKVLDEAKAKID
jgi:DNA-binding NtrC family response regulator